MYSTSSLLGVWHHIHGCLHQICQCKVQFDQYVTTNIGVLFPYMVSLYNAVATSCNQSFYKSHQGGNSQLQSSCDQLRFSPVASPSEKLQLDFKTLVPRVIRTQNEDEEAKSSWGEYSATTSSAGTRSMFRIKDRWLGGDARDDSSRAQGFYVQRATEARSDFEVIIC